MGEKLSHVDEHGRIRMVDVGGKEETERVARVRGEIRMLPATLRLVIENRVAKGNVLEAARLAGIMAAKRTAELIPLCHPLGLTSVDLDFELGEDRIKVEAVTRIIARTGVEMEALTAVAVAGLTLHDMIKAVDPLAELGEIRLLEKTGGKHGHWTRESSGLSAEGGSSAASGLSSDPQDRVSKPLDASAGLDTPTASAARPAALTLVSSTRAAAGTRDDTTSPVIAAWLDAHGFTAAPPRVVADADLAAALAEAVAEKPALILTTGGTGVAPRDVTPEAVKEIAQLDGAFVVSQDGTVEGTSRIIDTYMVDTTTITLITSSIDTSRRTYN